MAVNLKELAVFTPALYYDFDPEDTENYSNSRSYGFLIDGIQQKMDMAAALLYAQNEIYPKLKAGWQGSTPEELNHWLKEIHKRCTKTLLSDARFCGEYTPSYGVVLRWRLGCELYEPVLLLLDTEPSSSHYFELFRKTIEHFNIKDSTTFEAFCSLLRRQAHREEVILPRDFAKAQPLSAFALKRMQLAYHRGQLSDEEKELIEKFVIVCMLPDQIPAVMQTFATETIQAMLDVDTTDQQGTILTLAEIFYSFVKIHPFINGNGRTGTIFLNLMLISHGFPSILLRYSGDKENPESLYSKAMGAIEQSRLPLTELILNRIHADAYTNPLSETTFHLQLQLNRLCQHAENYFERSCVIALIDKLIQEFSIAHYQAKQKITETGVITRLSSSLEQGQLNDFSLLQDDPTLHDFQANVSDPENDYMQTQKAVAQYTLDRARIGLFSGCALFTEKDKLKKIVLKQLRALTGHSGWKCKVSEVEENHQPICAWIMFPTAQAESASAQIKNQLNLINATHSIVIKEGRQSKDPTQYMIRLDITHLDGLFPKLEEEMTEAISAVCI